MSSFRLAFWTGAWYLRASLGAANGVNFMKLFLKFSWVVAAVVFFSTASLVFAQRPGAKAVSAKAASNTYNIANDASLQGTVISYTENSQTPPIGAHVLLQTSAGNVDVHLGDARLLHLAKLNITPGANIRVVGQMSTVVQDSGGQNGGSQKSGQSSVFLARLVQVGAQLVAVRSDHGLPLGAGGLRANKSLLANAQADQKGGAR